MAQCIAAFETELVITRIVTVNTSVPRLWEDVRCRETWAAGLLHSLADADVAGGAVCELITSTGTGRLLLTDREVPIHYRVHAHVGGRVVMIELLDRPSGVASDERVRVLLESGRELMCQVLDDTPMCTVIGEGLSESGR
jgi:hypothetical protein